MEPHGSAHRSALIAQPVSDQRLEAIDDRIAELVAEALFDHLLKQGLVPSPTEPKEPQQGTPLTAP